MQIVITGFEPFSRSASNSSWVIAEAVAGKTFPGADISAVSLPVSFHDVGAAIDLIFEKYVPDLLVMLGQASSSPSIRLERIAVNMKDASVPDNCGECPDEEKILPDGPPAIFCPFSLKRMVRKLFAGGFPCTVSNTAGTYVCNTAYYHALYRSRTHSDSSVLFIHLPLCDNGCASDDGKCRLPQEVMEETVVEVIRYLGTRYSPEHTDCSMP